MKPLLIVYSANIVVAGWISISSLFFPKKALLSVFQNAISYSESIRLVGALWFAIFILSIIGLWKPERMIVVLLFQLIYKGTWIICVALPLIIEGKNYPKGMALFFLIWVSILPFVIPWKAIFS